MNQSNSNGKVVIHIGLPKTATSTLQTDVFPAFISDRIMYIGVFQPRHDVGQTDLYEKLYTSIETGKDLQLIHDSIKTELDKGITLVFSEEMFTVSSGHVSWKDKLSNLGKIVDGLEYEIILTVREASSAIFSYYCELFPRFSIGNKSFMEVALKHQDMEIYHYRKLLNTLQKSFELQRLHVFKFEDIIKGDMTGIIRVIDPDHDPDQDRTIAIKNQNMRQKTTTHVITENSFSLSDVPRRLIDFLGLNDAWIIRRLKPIVKPITKRLDNVTIKNIKVEKPSDDEMEKLRHSLTKETEELDKLFAIKY